MGSDGWDFDVPFRIGFFRAETAAQTVCNLQRSDEVIRSMRAPDDRILTMRELKDLAEHESN